MKSKTKKKGKKLRKKDPKTVAKDGIRN